MAGDMPPAGRASSLVRTRVSTRESTRKTAGQVAALLIAGALAGGTLLSGCARRSEFIGLAPTSDARPDTTDGTDAPAADAGDGGAGDSLDPSAAFCAADDPALPTVPTPAWNCPDGKQRCLLDPAIAPGVPAAFEAATNDPTAAPHLVYPLSGSVHPLNLSPLTVQWNRPPGAGQTAFRVHIAATAKPDTNSYDFYVPYSSGSVAATSPQEATVYKIEPAYWRWIGSQNPGAELQITVTGFDPAANKVATSTPVAIRLSAAPVEGGLFYLMADTGTIWRQVFGSTGGPTQLVSIPVAGVAELNCAGCHSVSRDGGRIAFSATYGGNLTVADTLNTASPLITPSRPPPGDNNATAPAINPDGTLVFARRAVPNGAVDLRDSASAGIIHDSKTVADLGGRIDYPEWSPTRSEIVATRTEGSTQPAEPSAAFDGHVVIVPIRLVAGRPTIGAPMVLARAGAGRTFGNPTFSPDGNWIVFVSRPAGQSSRGSAATRLHLVNRNSPAVIIDLGQATGATDSAATYPKFAPIAQNHCQQFFLTFQSRMDYGLVRIASQTGNAQFPQLWMTSIDLTKLSAPAADPSTPPLWLPFQDVTKKNLLPAWSAQIACDAKPSSCGEGATCVGGRCVVD
jgi:hypothetical protein